MRTAYQTLQLLPAPWNTAAARLAGGQTAVHLVNIADPKDGPSAGITFLSPPWSRPPSASLSALVSP